MEEKGERKKKEKVDIILLNIQKKNSN